jgi:hypothetical protein
MLNLADMRILWIFGVSAAVLAGCASEATTPAPVPGQLDDGNYSVVWHVAGKQPADAPPPALVELRAIALTPDRLTMDSEASCTACAVQMLISERDERCATIGPDGPRDSFSMCAIDTSNSVIATIPFRFPDGSWQTWWFVGTPAP